MKIIEFVGYPGSGKSYISNLIEQNSKNVLGLSVLSIEDLRNRTLPSKGKKFFWYLRIFISNFFKPVFIKTTCQILFKKKSFKHLKYYYDIYGSYGLVNKNNSYDYCIVSEGFVSFATYLFSGIEDEILRRKKCEKYLNLHIKYIKTLCCVFQIYNSSEEETLIHTSEKRKLDVDSIKKSIKKGDFCQTTNDHCKNLLWCQKQNIKIAFLENTYHNDDSLIFKFDKIIKNL